MKKLSEAIIKYRFPIIVFFTAVTVLSLVQLKNIEVDPEVKNMLPKNIKSRIDTDRIEDIFGGTDLLMAVFVSDDILEAETLKRIKSISRKISQLKEVDKVMSLFELKDISGDEGYMLVEPAVDKIPSSLEKKEQLKKRLRENDLVYKIVVSEDFRVTAVIATITENVSDIEIVSKFKSIVEQFPGNEKVYYGGMPVTRITVSRDIKTDIRKFLPGGILIMLIFLYFSFRQIRGVILPFMVVIMSITLSMGLLPVLGWKVSIPIILLPVIMIAIANDYGIHMIAKYQEENTAENSFSNRQLASKMFLSLGKPVIATGLTTIAGMLCMLSHIIVPAKQLAVLSAAGIAYALTASLLFIPAVTSLVKNAKPVKNSSKVHLLDKLLSLFADSVISHPGKIIFYFLVATIVLSGGIFLVKIDANPEKYYPEEHPVVVSSKIINDNLGGSQNISVMFSGDIKDPDMMKKIDSYEESFEQLDYVGNTSSIAAAVHEMSKAINIPGEEYYDVIPDSRNAIAQYFELYSMSGDPDDFDKLVDFPYENSHLMIRVNSADTPAIKGVADRIREMTAKDPAVTAIGGWGMIFTDLADHIVKGQFISLFFSTVVVSVMLMILFRSLSGGLFSIIPLVMSIIILFSLMGLLGIELNIATALLSSIMIGVGIDYTIHFIWRYREELIAGKSRENGIRTALTTTGRGIIFNAFSVIIGFIVLIFSSFMPVRFFGFLVVISIFSCLSGALLFIPALCLKYKPSFLEKYIKEEKNE